MSLDVSVLSQEDAGSPLYLTTACHRLIELGIYEEMDDEIAKLPGRKIPLLEKIIDSMIGKFGKGVIRSTLLFVYFSQGGIFEHELLHLVSQEVERMKRGEAKATRQGGGMSNEGTRLDEFSFHYSTSDSSLRYPPLHRAYSNSFTMTCGRSSSSCSWAAKAKTFRISERNISRSSLSSRLKRRNRSLSATTASWPSTI